MRGLGLSRQKIQATAIWELTLFEDINLPVLLIAGTYTSISAYFSYTTDFRLFIHSPDKFVSGLFSMVALIFIAERYKTMLELGTCCNILDVK